MSSYDVTTSVTGTGTATQDTNMGVVSTSAAINSSAYIQSVNSLRYRPGHSAMAEFTALFTTGVAGSTQKIGIFDDEDGFWLGYDGANFVVAYRNAGVDVTTSTFSGTGLDGVDLTKLNIFRIKFGWLGIAPVVFEIVKPGTTSWEVIHVFELQGVLTEPHIGNPAIPVRMEVENTTNATDIVMKTGSWMAGVFGVCATCGNRPFSHETSKTLAANTNEQAIINYKSLTTFQGKTNKVRAKLLRYQFFVDAPDTGGGTVTFRIKRGATIGGTPSYTNIDATNSVIQYDTAGTYTSGGVLGLSEFLAYSSQGNTKTTSAIVTDADSLNLFLDPGQVYTVTAQNSTATAVTVRVAFNWVELF